MKMRKWSKTTHKKYFTLILFILPLFFVFSNSTDSVENPDLSVFNPPDNDGFSPINLKLSSVDNLTLENITINSGDDLYEGVYYEFNASIFNPSNNNTNYFQENSSLQLNPAGFSTIFNISIYNLFNTFNQSNFSIVNVSANYTFYIKSVWRYRFRIQLNDSEFGYSDWIFIEVVKQPPANPNNFVDIEIHSILNIKKINEQGFSRVKIEGFLEASDYQKYIVRLNWVNVSNTWYYAGIGSDAYDGWGFKVSYSDSLTGGAVQVNNTGSLISFQTIEVYGNSFFSLDGLWFSGSVMYENATTSKSGFWGQIMPYGYNIREFPTVNAVSEEYSINFTISPANNVSNVVYHLFEANSVNYRNTNYELESQTFPFFYLQNAGVTIQATTKNFGTEPVEIITELTETESSFNWLWVENNTITFSNLMDSFGAGIVSIPALNSTTLITALRQSWIVNFSTDIQYLFPNYSLIDTNYEILKNFELESRGEVIDNTGFVFELEIHVYAGSITGNGKWNLTSNNFFSYPHISKMDQYEWEYAIPSALFSINDSLTTMNVWSGDTLVTQYPFKFHDFNSSHLITISDIYNPKQIYFGLYNFDGLGLSHDLFRFYINDERKDFGFNDISTVSNVSLKVLDFFNQSLYDQNQDLTGFGEFNIEISVFNLILSNNFSHQIYVEIERNNIEVKQTIPAHASINYRFLPNVEYKIRWFDLNGTQIGSIEINLDENNLVVSFGFFSTELPIDPEAIIVDFMTVFWFLIIVLVMGSVIVVFGRRLRVGVEERENLRSKELRQPRKIKKGGGFYNYD